METIHQLYVWGKPIVHPPQPYPNTACPPLTLPATPQQLSTGHNHLLLLTSDGLYAFGDNSHGQLGQPHPDNTSHTLLKIHISIAYTIIQVSCGYNHSLALDSQGNVYSTGQGENGELGLGSQIMSNRCWQLVVRGGRQISAGKDHSLALIGSKVKGWGNSREGQLGLLINRQYFNPIELNLYPCKTIHAGSKYSIFATSSGVYGSGLNQNGELGLGHCRSVLSPKRLSIEDEVLELRGGDYVAAGTAQGEWYLWGSGILGTFRFPTKMSFLRGADRVQLGTNLGIFSKNSKIYIWGSNAWGELSSNVGCNNYATQSEQFTQLNLKHFSCGSNFLAAISCRQGLNHTKYTEENSFYENEFYNANLQRNEMKFQGSCAFSSQYNCNNNKQKNQGGFNRTLYDNNIAKKLYNSQDAFREESSESDSMDWNSVHRQKQYVKLGNPTKSLKIQLLQKQNKQLKDKIQIERHQKERLQNYYMKRMNTMVHQRINDRINQLQSIYRNNHHPQQINDLCQHAPSFNDIENISFRPNVVENKELDRMGQRIQSLKNIFQQVYTNDHHL